MPMAPVSFSSRLLQCGVTLTSISRQCHCDVHVGVTSTQICSYLSRRFRFDVISSSLSMQSDISRKHFDCPRLHFDCSSASCRFRVDFTQLLLRAHFEFVHFCLSLRFDSSITRSCIGYSLRVSSDSAPILL